MFTYFRMAIAIALTGVSLGIMLGTSTADAHSGDRAVTVQQTPRQQMPDEVWIGDELVGKDSDENVRREIRRTYGNIGG